MKMKGMYILLAVSCFAALPAQAEGITKQQSETMKQLLATYGEKAKEEFRNKDKEKDVRGTLSDKPFSAAVGREFYLKRRTWQANDYTCSGCHTEDPKKEGKHIETKKPIKPLAPAANPDRFIDVQKVEKNFIEHCIDLHERDCTAYEKGNFIAYLMSVK
jgi:hypothetical protein